jgi:PAS domain S-box-containing protein
MDIERLWEQVARLEEENELLEEALGRNTRIFEALLKGSDQGIALTGPDRTIVRVIKGLTNLSTTSLSGQPIESLAIPEDREAILDAYRRLLRGEQRTIGLVVRVRHADGEVVRHAATLTDMLDDPCVHGIIWNYSVLR